MELLCAVDLLDGGAVRLVQGAYDRRSEFGDPLWVVRRYLEAGARWVHVVDLDAARSGKPVNRPTVAALSELVHAAGARVEVGGGVRSVGDVDAWVAAGCDRVVMGTSAVLDPSLAAECAERHPGRVAVGIDYRRRADGELEPAVRGWLEGGGTTVAELVGALSSAPFGALVVTAIERDGTGEGPDLDGLASVLDATELTVVASGGVGGPADLVRLAWLRSPLHGRAPEGVVVGRALVDGTMGVEEALAACVVSV